MFRQIRLLSGVRLLGALGINEARFGKDPKKKRRAAGMAVLFAFLGLMLMGYIGAAAYGFTYIGMAGLIPAFVFALTSLVVLFFSLYKAGAELFSTGEWEREAALPVRPAAIVISRFLVMYIWNVLLSAMVLIPGMLVYGISVSAPPAVYIMTVLGAFVLPLLPMTIASAAGALIFAAASRMRHKNVASIILSTVLTVGVIALSFTAGGTDDIAKLSASLIARFTAAFPPTALFTAAVADAGWLSFLLLAAIYAAAFAAFAAIVGRFYPGICRALASHTAKRDYRPAALRKASPVAALYKKELRRYFASSLYVLNTGIGYVLMVAASAALLIMGVEKLEAAAHMEGILVKLAPYILAFMCVISPPSTSAVSIEGKQWWIPKSYPVTAKEVMDGKLLVSLTVALPCWLVSEVLLAFAVRTDAIGHIMLAAVPLSYIIFASVMGLFVNIRMPVFAWDSETTVIKQSGAVLVAMLIGFASAGIPAALAFVLPQNAVSAVATVALLAASALLYRAICAVRLTDIG